MPKDENKRSKMSLKSRATFHLHFRLLDVACGPLYAHKRSPRRSKVGRAQKKGSVRQDTTGRSGFLARRVEAVSP